MVSVPPGILEPKDKSDCGNEGLAPTASILGLGPSPGERIRVRPQIVLVLRVDPVKARLDCVCLVQNLLRHVPRLVK